jgi:PAS domain S-box-containing protein
MADGTSLPVKTAPSRASAAGAERHPVRQLTALAAAGLVPFALVVATVVARERRLAQDHWRARLEAVADDRKQALDRWLSDGLADAAVVASYPTARYALARRRGGPLPFPVEQGPQGHLSELLTSVKDVHGYAVAYVVGAEGRVVASSRGQTAVGSTCLESAREGLAEKARRVVLHRHDEGSIAVAFVAPVLAATPSDEGPAGVAALEVAAADWLFPLLTRAPFPSRTAETVLMSQEGGHARFLSPLRHDASPALSVTRPLSDPNFAAAEALAGREVFGSFLDYRRAPILAVTRKLDSAPWGLVAKVDTHEVMSQVREQMTLLGLASAGVYAAFVAGVYALWQRQHSRFARAEAKTALALQHANDAILLVGDGRILDALGAAERMYGRSRDELRNLSAADLLVPEEHDRLRADLDLVAAEGARVFETVHQSRGGRAFPVEVSSRRHTLAGESVVVSIVRDITERRQRTESLRKLSRAVEQSPASVIITDPTGAIEYVNPKFTQVTGYTFAEVLGQNPRILKSGRVPPETYAELWRAISSGEEWRGELVNRRRNGELLWEAASISPIVDEGGRVTHFVAVKEDITERKRAEEALAETREQLYRSQKLEAVGRLAGAVAHDFNNLLSVITGYGEILARSLPEEGPARRRLGQILKAAGRAAALTRQLLAFSRRQVLNPKVLNLNDVVHEMEKMLRRVIPEDVELRVRAGPDLGSVRVDPGQIEQVIMNLAVNARDAMPSGGVIEIETANADLDAAYANAREPVRPGPYVLLAVSDTGVGMDEATRSRIFEPFFTTKPLGEGTGLGLSTVYGIVKQSDGYVWVYSEPGRGTTFKVYLPRVDEAPGPRRPAAPEPPATSRGETILLVEDQPSVREMVRESLESLGYVVLDAEGGEQALDIARSHGGRIDLLVTDVVMPRMSGRAVAEEVATLRPGIRVLYCSGHPNEIVARQGLLEPGVNLLEKPFTIATLARRLREVLGPGESA